MTTPQPPDIEPDGEPRGDPRPRWWLELLALSALGVAQPLFDLLARHPTFLVAHHVGAGRLLVFTGLVYLGPPLALGALEALAWSRRPALAERLHLGARFALAALLVLPPLYRTGMGSAAALALAAGLAGLATLALTRSTVARTFVTLLALLSPVVPVVFLARPPAADILRPASVPVHRVQIGNPVPVVLVILDELPLISLLGPSRQIDADLYPNFAALAARSHWYRNATTVAPLTDLAVPAILTGRRPRDVAPTAAEHPDSLFTLLGGSYEMRVIESQTRVCPASLCGGEDPARDASGRLGLLVADAAVAWAHLVAPRELRARLPSISVAWGGFLGGGRPTGAGAREGEGSASDEVKMHIWAADRRRDFDRFLDSLEGDGAPRLYFLHAMLPHVPWVYLPSGREYWGSLYAAAHAPGVAPDTTWTGPQWLVDRAYQRHLAQVAYVDRLLGKLLDRLAETGLDDEALLVVVSDHGFSFRAGQRGRHPDRENFAEILPVPLFVRLPGQTEPVVSDRNVETVDVLATLAEALDLELPFDTDGVSALSESPERSGKRVAVGGGEELRFEPYDRDAKFETLDRKLDLFPEGLFRLGPHRELLGRPVASLELGAPAAVEVRLDQPQHYREVDLSGDFLPAQVFGRVRRERSDVGELDLALALNGVVRSVTRTWIERRDERFAALVPEESFRDGANTVDVFVVRATSGGPVLHPTGGTAPPEYALESGPDGEAERLVSSDGAACALDPRWIEGGYERRGTAVVGWARDPSGGSPYAVIMAFADGRLVHTGTTGAAPPAGAGVAGPGYERAGFHFVLPAAILHEAADVRVFAVLGLRGAELRPLS